MKQRIASLLATVCLLVATGFSQNPATFGTAGGRYGQTAWAINNQRVASQFNYYINSTSAAKHEDKRKNTASRQEVRNWLITVAPVGTGED